MIDRARKETRKAYENHALDGASSSLSVGIASFLSMLRGKGA